MNSYEEIRETFSTYGEDALNLVDHITVINGKTLPTTTHALLSSLTMRELLNVTTDEFMRMDGIGAKAAERIVAALNLGKKLNSRSFGAVKNIGGPDDAFQMLRHLSFLEQEHMDVIYVGTKNEVISIRNIFIGGLNSSIVHPREIFKHAIKLSAYGIILAHNHPSGDPKPSSEDITATLRIQESGKILGIKVLDHIIVAGDRYLSMTAEGLMNYTQEKKKGA